MPALDLTRSQARIIDPVLTEVALGYHNPANVGEMLMPRVMMESSGARVPEFGQEAFFDYDTERAPGSDTLQVSVQVEFAGHRHRGAQHRGQGSLGDYARRDGGAGD